MDKISIITGDILDLKKLKSAMAGADFVIHLAANTGVPQSVESFLDCKVNVLGTLNMLEAARAVGIQRFVFASSGAPLGFTPPLNEKLVPKPMSPEHQNYLEKLTYPPSIAVID